MLHRLLVCCLLVVASGPATPAQARLYLAPDDHTDYFWTADDKVYEQAFLEMLDYYLGQIDATAGEPPEHQARWNCDGYLWLWTYEQHRSAAQFQRLIDRIKDGHISVPLNALTLCLGGAPAEAVLRGMYYPGKIERQHGVRFPLAYSIENHVLPYGLSSLWAGCGAKYSWKGICGCDTRTAHTHQRPNQMYWYTGPDGKRVLMKWYSMHNGNKRLGGYAEARDPNTAVADLTAMLNTPAYPYHVAGAFGQGWDDLKTMTSAFVTAAKQHTTTTRRVRVSNELDFFVDFEATHGANLPSESRAFGNEWELLSASMAEVSARVRRAVEKLRSAEAMAVLAAQADPTFLAGRETARDTAWRNLGLYWEHDWHGNGNVSRARRAAFQRQMEAGITGYVDRLHDDAVATLGAQIQTSGTAPRFFVFNPLSWSRDDVVDLPFAPTGPARVLDVSTGQEVPSQVVQQGGQTRLRILARRVPSLGYRCFEVVSGPSGITGGPVAAATTLENPFLRLTVDGRGAITSLVDKTQGNREFVRRTSGRSLNDPGGVGSGTISIENSGTVSATLRIDSLVPWAHTTRITIYRESPRVDIQNEITQNFSGVETWGFGMNLTNPDVYHEEVGAILRAKTTAQGGHYAVTGGRYDWLTMNHFADVRGDGGVGLLISNADCAFMRLGASTPTQLDTGTPLLAVLIGGQVDGRNMGIRDQDGDSHFMQRFALRSHGAATNADGMRFALAHQNPLVAGPVVQAAGRYPETSYSMFETTDPDVLIWAVKPHEDGMAKGIVTRLWNLRDQPASVELRPGFGSIAHADAITHIESPRGAVPRSGRAAVLDLARQEIRSLSVQWQGATDVQVTPEPAIRIGGRSPLRLMAPGESGRDFVMACAMATTPAIQIGGRTIPLAADPLLQASLETPALFEGFFGTLDETGRGTAAIHLPNDPQLVGLAFYAAFVTLDPQRPGGISEVSRATRLVIE